MQTVLVTGGAGFIGSHLCEKLLKLGNRVVALDNLNAFYDPALKLQNLDEIRQTASDSDGEFVFIEGDIRDKDALDALFSEHKPEIVVHLAAMAGVRPSIENPELYVEVNVNGTVAVLEAMKRHDCKQLIFASSSSVYGNNKKVPFSESDNVDNPISPYAATKKAGELLCYTYSTLNHMSVACLRFFTVYGPRQRPDLAIRKFTELMLAGKEIPFYGDGTTARDYTYVDDTVSGIVAAMGWVQEHPGAYDIFNLGNDHTVTLEEMVRTLAEALQMEPKLKRLPMQPGDVDVTWADNMKTHCELLYCPRTSLSDGVENLVREYAKIKDRC